MIVLAEIAKSKIPSISEIWIFFYPSGSSAKCTLEGSFSAAARQELRGAWIVSSFASAWMPTEIVLLVTAFKWRGTITGVHP